MILLDVFDSCAIGGRQTTTKKKTEFPRTKTHANGYYGLI